MGNKTSSLNQNQNQNKNQNQKSTINEFIKHIDVIASNYILTQNFQDMTRLQNEQFCNKIIILTSKILDTKLNHLEIEILDQRTAGKTQTKKTGMVTYLHKNNIDKLDLKDKDKKKQICIGVATFYVKIAHLFSAIVKTLNPIFTYTDSYGYNNSVSLLEKHRYPKLKNFMANSKVTFNNLCSKRINVFNIMLQDNLMSIQSNLCKLNASQNIPHRKYHKQRFRSYGYAQQQDMKDIQDTNTHPRYSHNQSSYNPTLNNEIGIPELEKLYYDVFDVYSKNFTKMSDKTKERYRHDLEIYYKAFTGKNKLDKHVTSFSNIPLTNYNKSKNCRNNVFNETYVGNKKDKLFHLFGTHMSTMIHNAETNQSELIKVIDEIFIKQDKKIAINPKLNNKTLDQLIEYTREVIAKLYITCEEDFQKAVQIFEAIIEQQHARTSISREEKLQQTRKGWFSGLF
tara:strand:- start:1927 stop:3291 length:1365 start_codon:yes stop_codon:yes gene_type:complete